MARAKKSVRSGARRKGGRAAAKSRDAISLLKADHQQVKDWFDEFERARSDSRKQELSAQICQALRVHAQIEEEIFYPAFLEATDEEDIHHEAEVEHEGAKRLIEQVASSGPDDDYYDAKVKVLSEMIKHHVNEEERRDGMFAKARHSSMNLEELGQQLATRKAQLMGEELGEGQTARKGAVRSPARAANGATRLIRGV